MNSMKIFIKATGQYIPEADCLGYKIMNDRVHAICVSSRKPPEEYSNLMMYFANHKVYLFWKDVSEIYDWGVRDK